MSHVDEDRDDYVARLDDEMLKGGVILSEWCVRIIQDVDTAFSAGADLATVVLAMAAIESHLRFEYGQDQKERFFDLIEKSPLDVSLKEDLHALRRYRNSWVHISDPSEDENIQRFPQDIDNEITARAYCAVLALRRVIYDNQWI